MYKRQAQSSKKITCRSEYLSIELYAHIHTASLLCSWSMELVAFAGLLFPPKHLDHLLTTSVCHSNTFLTVNDLGRRNRPLREAHSMLKPGFFEVVSTYVNPLPTPRMISPATPCQWSGSTLCPGAPRYGMMWVHLIAFSRCGLDLA